MEQIIWHNLNLPKIFSLLKSNKRGLSEEESKQRLKKYGQNKLPSKKRLTSLIILLKQLNSPLIYILLIAGIISLLLKEHLDASVILLSVLVNTMIGFVQENKAERSLEALKKLLHRQSKVIRDGQEKLLNIEEIVPGDIVLLSAGNFIPADGRLLTANNLQIVEASLTGESVPSNKNVDCLAAGTMLADRENMVYMGTIVASGKGSMVVCQTGLKTELGRIATLIKETKEDKTPLQKKIIKLSGLFGIIVAVVCTIILLVGLLKQHSFIEMLLTSVAIAVAAIPEGLAVVITVILAIGMQRILKKKGLVRKLVAAETLGSTTVICCDKTGTLTEGKMRVNNILSTDRNLSLKIALLCNNAVLANPKQTLKDQQIIGEPTERALLLSAIQSDLSQEKLNEQYPRLDEIPFSSENKFMATLHLDKNSGKKIIYLKGAPEKLLEWSMKTRINGMDQEINRQQRKVIQTQCNELTKQGLRVLAVGYKDANDDQVKLNEYEIKQGLTLIGLIALKDPLRSEIKETIKICRSAGLRIMIVTGDHLLTAQAIAQEIGISASEKHLMLGEKIDHLNDQEFSKAIQRVNVFARVEPRHKLRIIDALQSAGEVVAMTGDGVNDAPAVKSADIGLALGSGSDVTKETADVILLDNNFKTIVEIIKQGRFIFDNIKKVVLYLLTSSFSEMILILGSLLMGMPLPVTAAQILWINLVEDGFPDFALAFEPGEPEVMTEKPRGHTGKLLDKEMKVLIFVIGLITDVILLSLYYYLYRSGYDFPHLRTLIFVALGFDSLLYVFSCRSLRHSIFHKHFFSNIYLLGAVAVGWIMLLLAVYLPVLQVLLRTVPLGLTDWSIVLTLGLIKIILIEMVKHFFIVKKAKK
ncbi:MAG: HAD-IC family P-type ATPase [Candidatus Aenigmarchaeota archaeon]|nr:HAD-IC family P-type ATPase [Candidatus Aenigmarchaeota archaeon]